MRIIIFTDSLGRPRPDISDTEKTEYEDVYGYKLKKYFDNKHEIELIYIDSLDTDDAIYWSQRMVAFRKPDIVIFQFGLNDCVPRLFKKNSKSIILNNFFKKITFNVFFLAMSYFRRQITFLRRIVYVSKEKFFINLTTIKSEILKYNNSCKFIILSIAKSDKNNLRSFNYNKNIDEYNNIFLEVFGQKNYIDVNSILNQDDFISDNIHLSKKGHLKIYQVLKNKIEEL
jgi:lysophospholipase L1-like esterase